MNEIIFLIEEAVECHFEEDRKPKLIRLNYAN